jgi:hypothetical protein
MHVLMSIQASLQTDEVCSDFQTEYSIPSSRKAIYQGCQFSTLSKHVEREVMNSKNKISAALLNFRGVESLR